MLNIEVNILNKTAIDDAAKMMVCAARLTQRGHCIKNMSDFNALYDSKFTENTLEALQTLPHPTIQKFGLINIALVGVSRRFLAQITRHQNEVKFMSTSLQYSDYSDDAAFVIPFSLLNKPAEKQKYLENCKAILDNYKHLSKIIGNDDAAYLMPQSLRTGLIISATLFQWKHMLSQRICKRNTTETRYVMLKIWEKLYEYYPQLFSQLTTGPQCMRGKCLEGKFSCASPYNKDLTPTQILKNEFSMEVNDGIR